MIGTHAVYIIAAVDARFGIGKTNALPWRFKKELAHFSRITKKTADPEKYNMVIMGRSTWESLPAAFRPLPGRVNVVLTRNTTTTDAAYAGATMCDSLDAAFALADESIESIFIAGGASVYAQAITDERIDGIYLTHIGHTYDCDTFFPQIPAAFSSVTSLGEESENDILCRYQLLQRS